MLGRFTLLFLVAVATSACDGDSTSTGDGEAGSDGDGDGGDDGQGGGPLDEPPQGLFDCELPLTCGEMTQHAGMVMGGSVACVADVALSGEIGSAIYRDAPGPYVTISEGLYIYTGDGFAIRQGRGKSCMCTHEIPWGEPGPIQRCEVEVSAEVQEACEADEPSGCWTTPPNTVKNCQTMETPPTCDELRALLGAE